MRLAKREERNAKSALDNFKSQQEFDDYQLELSSLKKKSYKRLADTMEKQTVLNRIGDALDLEQLIAGKGKKRKIVKEDGTVEWTFYP